MGVAESRADIRPTLIRATATHPNYRRVQVDVPPFTRLQPQQRVSNLSNLANRVMGDGDGVMVGVLRSHEWRRGPRKLYEVAMHFSMAHSENERKQMERGTNLASYTRSIRSRR